RMVLAPASEAGVVVPPRRADLFLGEAEIVRGRNEREGPLDPDQDEAADPRAGVPHGWSAALVEGEDLVEDGSLGQDRCLPLKPVTLPGSRSPRIPAVAPGPPASCPRSAPRRVPAAWRSPLTPFRTGAQPVPGKSAYGAVQQLPYGRPTPGGQGRRCVSRPRRMTARGRSSWPRSARGSVS